MSSRIDPLFVLFVTDGVALEFPPEVYRRRTRATLEAERWAWFLSGSGWLDIDRPFEGRWSVGDRDVSLVEVEAESVSAEELWIAQFRTRDGDLDPEAILLNGRDAARSWIAEPPSGTGAAVDILDLPWFVAATYRMRGEDAYAIASLAKVIA